MKSGGMSPTYNPLSHVRAGTQGGLAKNNTESQDKSENLTRNKSEEYFQSSSEGSLRDPHCLLGWRNETLLASMAI